MTKFTKYVSVILVLILSLRGLYSFYQSFFYGNPQKIEKSEEMVLEYLKEEKGYTNQDIIMIKGIYNWKEAHDSKYGGHIILKENTNETYEYGIRDRKIKEYGEIPNNRK